MASLRPVVNRTEPSEGLNERKINVPGPNVAELVKQFDEILHISTPQQRSTTPPTSPKVAAQDKAPQERFSDALLHHATILSSPEEKELTSRRVQPAPPLQPSDETLATLIEQLVAKTPDEKAIQKSVQALLGHFHQEASSQEQTPDYQKQLSTSFHRLITSFRCQHTERLNLRSFFERINTSILPLLVREQSGFFTKEIQILKALSATLYQRALPAMVHRDVKQIFQAIQNDSTPSIGSPTSADSQPDLPTAVHNLRKSLNPLFLDSSKIADSSINALARELERCQYPCSSQANQKLFDAIHQYGDHFLRSHLQKAYKQIRLSFLIPLLPKQEDERLGALGPQSKTKTKKKSSSTTGTLKQLFRNFKNKKIATLRKKLNKLSHSLRRRKSLEVSAPAILTPERQARFNQQIKEAIESSYLHKKDQYAQSLQRAIEAGKKGDAKLMLAAFDDAAKLFEEAIRLPASFGKWLPEDGIWGSKLKKHLAAEELMETRYLIISEILDKSPLSNEQAQQIHQTAQPYPDTVSLLSDKLRDYIDNHPEKFRSSLRNQHIQQKIYDFTALISLFIMVLEERHRELIPKSPPPAQIRLDQPALYFFRTRIGLLVSFDSENKQLHFAYSQVDPLT